MGIKQLTIISHPPGTAKTYKKSDTSFDERGNKLEYKEYKGGKICIWEQFLYDNENRMIEAITYSGDSFKMEDYKPSSKKYLYDHNGNLISGDDWIEECTADGNKTLSTFYINGSIKSRKFLDIEGKCFEEHYFQKESLTKKIRFNEEDKVLEVRNFRSDGHPLNFTINEYNNNSQLVRTKSVSLTGNVSENRVLKYNERGLLIEDIDHPPDITNAFVENPSNGYCRKYFYDDERLKSEDLYLVGELIMSYKYEYIFW